MTDHPPRQLKMPAPVAPAPKCRGCGCPRLPGGAPDYSLGTLGWICLDCWRDPHNYWAHDYSIRDKPKRIVK